jgi:uncharacterized phage protein (TIGR02218 family)
MAKTISPALKEHLAQEVTTICSCWQMTRLDGVSFYFTDHDQDLAIDGNTYLAALGYQRTAIQSSADMSVDNLDLQGLFDSSTLTVEDLRTGLFDFADIFIFVVNWADLTQGKLQMRRGKLGDIVATPSGTFTTQLRGLTQMLQQNVGELYTPWCRADLGDSRCKIDLVGGGWQVAATVASVVDEANFTITVTEPRAVDGWFNEGVVTFTSGADDGRSMEIKFWTQAVSAVHLHLPMPASIAIGDTLTLYPGCDKTVATCAGRFNNMPNFRGEPYVPGADAFLATPAIFQ